MDTVYLDQEKDELVILDQTLLPLEERYLHLWRVEEIVEAIARLRVRGAPAIGVAAAIGLYAASVRIQASDTPSFLTQVRSIAAQLAASRPTAVNLTWALGQMEALLDESQDIPTLLARLKQQALRLWEEDIAVCRHIGEHGVSLLKDGMGILTHCNAGRLAAVRYGTALAPIYVGQEQGLTLHVYADETRPLLQGARLTAYELCRAGVDVTLLCDNMAADAMARGHIQAVFVGCDRVAANGDTANKIGTFGVAILARHFGIPFYVCAPASTIDLACPTGRDIHIEQRDGEEVRSLWYQKPMAPRDVQIYNPAFDVTDASLITAFVTEYGVIRPPFLPALAQVKEKANQASRLV